MKSSAHYFLMATLNFYIKTKISFEAIKKEKSFVIFWKKGNFKCRFMLFSTVASKFKLFIYIKQQGNFKRRFSDEVISKAPKTSPSPLKIGTEAQE